MSKIIKEYCPEVPRCVLREDNYYSGLDKFNKLFREAKKDFPKLKQKDVKVLRYGGDRIAKTFGIEFAPIGDVPPSYFIIYQLEYTG